MSLACGMRGSNPVMTGLSASTVRPRCAQLMDHAAGDEGLADIGAGGGDEDGGHAAIATRVRTRSASRAMSASSWRAVKAKRSRAVSAGTVGGRIGTTRKPSASRRRAAVSAASAEPTISGTIWLVGRRQAGAGSEGARLGERHGGQRGVGGDEIERGDGGSDHRGGQGGGVDEGAGAVLHQLDHRRGGAEIAAIAADRLRQRSHLQRHVGGGAGGEGRAAAAAEDPDAVGIVRHQPGVVFAREPAERGEGGEVAVHGEHAVGEDQGLAMAGAALVQQRPQVVEIVVPERHDGRAGEPRPRPQAGMGEFVDQHEVAAAGQRRDNAGIGEIAGTEHASRSGALEPRQPGLQRVIKRMISGHQPGGAGADAVLRDGFPCRIGQRGMAAQAEIIVA